MWPQARSKQMWMNLNIWILTSIKTRMIVMGASGLKILMRNGMSTTARAISSTMEMKIVNKKCLLCQNLFPSKLMIMGISIAFSSRFIFTCFSLSLRIRFSIIEAWIFELSDSFIEFIILSLNSVLLVLSTASESS